MPFDTAQKQHILDSIAALGVRECPLCGGKTLAPTDLIPGISVDGADEVIPIVPVACKQCGHIMVFSADLLGLA
jgi:hypothetical protein